MKTRLFTAAVIALSFSAFSQGKISMGNDMTRLVYFGNDVLPPDSALAGQVVPLGGVLPSGVTLVADLYGGPNAASMTFQISQAISPSVPGVFGPHGLQSSNLLGGVSYTWQVKVRAAAFATAEAAQLAGSYAGYSELFTGRPGSSLAFFAINNTLANNFQSTWQPGTFDLGGGAFGAIEVNGPPSTIPYFYQHPAGQSVTVGSTVNLSVVTGGGVPMSYQWRRDDAPIEGATNAALTLTNVALGEAGHYDIVATNSYGSTTSSNVMLQVLPTNAPSIRVNDLPAVGTVTVPGSATITITGGFSGGFIFYTLDGTAPATGSTLYSGAFVIATNRTIRAMSLSADFSQSSEAPAVNVVLPPLYSLTVSTSGGGGVNLSPPTGPYTSNSVVTLTAAADANWIFDHWNGDLSGNGNPTNLTMNGPRSVQAVFVPTAHPLTISTPGGGSVTANGQSIAANTYYPTGSVVSLEAAPASGWSFLRWEGTATSTQSPFNLTMSQTQNVQAVFGTVVGTNIGGSGSISMSVSNPVPYGTLLTVTAVPSLGYNFVTWSGAASGTIKPTTVTVTNATPVVGALFAASPGPTIIMQPSSATVLLGKGAAFNVQAMGTAPLTYQWRRSGTNVSGATSTNYAITRATATDAGNYYVVVTNGVGSTVTSSNASLTVNPWLPVAFESVTRLPDGRVQFVITGQSNETLWIDHALGLPPSWLELTNLLNTTGTITFTDSLTNNSRRFYRARQ